MLPSLSSIGKLENWKCRLRKMYSSNQAERAIWAHYNGHAGYRHNCIFLLIYATLSKENLVLLKSATYNIRVVNSHFIQGKYKPVVLFQAVFLPRVLVYFSWHYIYSSVFLRHSQKGWKQNKEIKQHYLLRREVLCINQAVVVFSLSTFQGAVWFQEKSHHHTDARPTSHVTLEKT